jgi:hypothetical protein
MPDTAQPSSQHVVFSPRQPLISSSYPKATPFAHAKGGRASASGNNAGSIFSSGVVRLRVRPQSVVAIPRPHSGVVPEKRSLTRALKASQQSGAVAGSQSAGTVCSNCHRSQSRSMPQLKLIQTTSWIDPRVRAELEREATNRGLSLSEVVAMACRDWVCYEIHRQQTTLFETK